jgi:hypothetical protein
VGSSPTIATSLARVIQCDWGFGDFETVACRRNRIVCGPLSMAGQQWQQLTRGADCSIQSQMRLGETGCAAAREIRTYAFDRSLEFVDRHLNPPECLFEAFCQNQTFRLESRRGLYRLDFHHAGIGQNISNFPQGDPSPTTTGLRLSE